MLVFVGLFWGYLISSYLYAHWKRKCKKCKNIMKSRSELDGEIVHYCLSCGEEKGTGICIGDDND